MARFALNEFEAGFIGTRTPDAKIFFDLGMMYAVGRSVPVDLVAAHKWFNLSSLRGSEAAKAQRESVAAEMSPTDVQSALQAARQFLAANR
ncbi:MAG: sel1 repeat family protein [Pseudomonadota bacterium]